MRRWRASASLASPSWFSTSPAPTTSAPSSIAGRWPLPLPAPSWVSMPSISPMCRMPRTAPGPRLLNFRSRRGSTRVSRCGKRLECGPIRPCRLLAQASEQLLQAFLGAVKKNDYIAINAYLPRHPGMVALLQDLRSNIGRSTGCATTVGFGPRFLHSTGQLHKGGPDEGLFLQITADPLVDADIPTQAMSFGTLERAQALGDYEGPRRPWAPYLAPPPAFAGIFEGPGRLAGVQGVLTLVP